MILGQAEGQAYWLQFWLSAEPVLVLDLVYTDSIV